MFAVLDLVAPGLGRRVDTAALVVGLAAYSRTTSRKTIAAVQGFGYGQLSADNRGFTPVAPDNVTPLPRRPEAPEQLPQIR